MRAAVLFVAGLSCFSIRITDVAAAGNVGCVFRPELCENDEYCFNDYLFGHCKSPDAPTNHHHQSLAPPLQRLLEKELKRLFVGGYRWQHDYTQCVVQNLLFADKHRLSYDPGLCARLLQMHLPSVTKEILEQLEKIDPEDLALIRFNPSMIKSHPDYADEVFIPGSQRPKSTSTIVALPGGTAFELEAVKRKAPFQLPSHQQRHLSEHKENINEENSSLLRTLLSSLQHLRRDAGTWIEKGDGDDSDRYPNPDEEVPIVETDLSSDLEQRPVYSEGGTQWVPVNNNSNSAEQFDSSITSDHRFSDQFSGESLPEDSGSEEGPLLLKTKIRSEILNRGNQLRARQINQDSYENDPDDIIENGESSFESNNAPNDDQVEDENENEDELWHPFTSANNVRREDPDMLPFSRPMRYDIKKPGPSFYIHETGPEDESDEPEKALLDLLKVAQQGKEQNQWKDSRTFSPDDGTGTVAEKFSSVRDLTGEEESIQDALAPFDSSSSKNSGYNKVPAVSSAGWNVLLDQHKNQQILKSKDQKVGDPPHSAEDDIHVVSNKREYIRPTLNLPQRQQNSGRGGHYEAVDSTQAYLLIQEGTPSMETAEKLVKKLESLLHLPVGTFSNIRLGNSQVNFKVNPNPLNLNASIVVEKAEDLSDELKEDLDVTVLAAGIGDKTQYEVIRKGTNDHKLFILTFVLCGGIAGVLIAVAVVYVVRRHARSRQKLQNLAQPETEASQDYQDLCRQRMQRKNNEKPEPIQVVQQPKRVSSLSQSEVSQPSPSSRSSTSSWSEEPVTSNMDISTGHMILTYMEDHLKNKDRLEREWEALCAYEAEPCATNAATLPQNLNKNRFPDVLPYDHSRVILNDLTNVSSSDYINASTITDHDPRNPAYIATQGPLPQTAADFWQMIWEQGSVVIVTLTRLMENGFAMCHRYWPEEGSEVYHIYEVHLVSEHIWCDDYLVRSFYLKNLKTSETRTVTQFHFLSWPENGVPASTKALLEFRRKVNKSYRGRSCPIVAHCSDGSGRTGTYCLIDMVLNRMAKGAKEIDIAATLEHIRDQRTGMVKTKAQFEFVLMAIAEEVHAILKALSQ